MNISTLLHTAARDMTPHRREPAQVQSPAAAAFSADDQSHENPTKHQQQGQDQPYQRYRPRQNGGAEIVQIGTEGLLTQIYG